MGGTVVLLPHSPGRGRHVKAGPVVPVHCRPGGGVRISVLDRSTRFVDDVSGVGVARRRRWEHRYARLLVGYDAVVGVVAAMSAYLLRFPDGSLSWAYGYALATFAAPLLWVGAIALSGGYEARVLGLGSEEFQRIFRAFVGLSSLATLIQPGSAPLMSI